MRKLLRGSVMAFVTLAAATVAWAAPRAQQGDEAVADFHMTGHKRRVVVSKDHVAVRVRLGSKAAKAGILSDGEFAAFASMGVEIVPRAKLRSESDIIGYPVWFDKDKGAVAVLTHEIFVRTDDAVHLKDVQGETGFASLEETSFKKGLYRAKFTSPMAALNAAAKLAEKPGIRYAHPNFMVPKVWRGAVSPTNEPYFPKQWHLANDGSFQGALANADIHVKEAWDVTTGDPEVLVAVLDGGFEMAHPDLDGAWFRNRGEIPGNGVDDDGNGYVDDVSGWNFRDKTNDPTTGAVDDHGTAVSGLVAARANGKGVTGVCPQCSVLPVVVSWYADDDAAAFYYAQKQGAEIITNSWGYPVGIPASDVVVEAINDVAAHGRGGKGTIILFAMNNFDQDDCIGETPDISSLDSVIAVSGSSDQDKKVRDSAWGDCMEYLSPTQELQRQGIVSTDLTGRRGYNNGRVASELPDVDYTNEFGGTSAATPISAGVFALMLAVNPELTRDDALALVLSTTDKIDPETARYDAQTGFSKKYGYGRINAGRAVRAAQVFKKYSKNGAQKRGREAL